MSANGTVCNRPGGISERQNRRDKDAGLGRDIG
jgi:hypothetical protein